MLRLPLKPYIHRSGVVITLTEFFLTYRSLQKILVLELLFLEGQMKDNGFEIS